MGRPALRVAGALAASWLVALVGLVLVLGPPMAMVRQTGAAPFAVKLGYTLAVASLAAIAAIAAGRPGQKLGGPIALIGVPFVIILAVAALELLSSDPAAWGSMASGTTYWDCVQSVAIASLPVLIGMMWAYRILAPTRLALAGFLAGLCAGAAGAVAFALYCHETTAVFLVTAYTPAILIPALIGAVIARPVLRW